MPLNVYKTAALPAELSRRFIGDSIKFCGVENCWGGAIAEGVQCSIGKALDNRVIFLDTCPHLSITGQNAFSVLCSAH